MLPQEFFDADAPQYDTDVPAINNQQGTSTSSSSSSSSCLKRKSNVHGTLGNGGINNAATTTTTTTGSGSRGLDTRLVTAALNALGRQQQQQQDGSTTHRETVQYWKHREVVEGEHAKRAKMDSEVHRFKILDQMLPTLLDAEKRASMEAVLQKQKAEFCQQLLQSGEKNSDTGATTSSSSGEGKERDKREDTQPT